MKKSQSCPYGFQFLGQFVLNARLNLIQFIIVLISGIKACEAEI